eukprot:scaffold9322_cov168-Amphora_coffeaeformis.AAC.9
MTPTSSQGQNPCLITGNNGPDYILGPTGACSRRFLSSEYVNTGYDPHLAGRSIYDCSINTVPRKDASICIVR